MPLGERVGEGKEGREVKGVFISEELGRFSILFFVFVRYLAYHHVVPPYVLDCGGQNEVACPYPYPHDPPPWDQDHPP